MAAQKAAARKTWEEQQSQRALSLLPFDCPPEVRLQAHDRVREVLSRLGPDSSADVVRKVVEAAVELAVQPHMESQRIAAALNKAARQLPASAWGGNWEDKARKLATEALQQYAGPKDQSNLDRVTCGAVAPVVREYEHSVRIQQTKESLRYWRLGQATEQERAEATRAAYSRLVGLPVGASQESIDEAMETALRPFERALDKRLESRLRQVEAQRIADRAVTLLRHHLSTGWEWDSYTEQAEATQELSEELYPLIESKYVHGSITEEELEEYVQEWAAERLDEDDD